MITADEIKLYIKELKNNPEKAPEFLKSIRITSEKHKHSSRCTIYNEKKEVKDIVPSSLGKIEQVKKIE